METAAATTTMEVTSEVVEIAPATVDSAVLEDKEVYGGGASGGAGDPSDIPDEIGAAADEPTVHCSSEEVEIATVSVTPLVAPAPAHLEGQAKTTSNPESVPEMAAVMVETVPTSEATSVDTTPSVVEVAATDEVEQVLPREDPSASVTVAVAAVAAPVMHVEAEPAVDRTGTEGRMAAGTTHEVDIRAVEEDIPAEEALPSGEGIDASVAPPAAAPHSSPSATLDSSASDASPAVQKIQGPLEVAVGSTSVPPPPESANPPEVARSLLPEAVPAVEAGEPTADYEEDNTVDAADQAGDADAMTSGTSATSAPEATEAVSTAGPAEPTVVASEFSGWERTGHEQEEGVPGVSSPSIEEAAEPAGIAARGTPTEEEGGAPKGEVCDETETTYGEAPAAGTTPTTATVFTAPAPSDTPAAPVASKPAGAPEIANTPAPEADDGPTPGDASSPSDAAAPAVASESTAVPVVLPVPASSADPGVSTASSAAAQAEESAARVTEEMKDFLEDSEVEDGESDDEEEARSKAEEVKEVTDIGEMTLTVDAEESQEPRIHGPRSPTQDTEFSASHAQRIIGPGVVLERKASISAVAVEVKNKSEFSAQDAAATIKSGAISERTRLLKEEQEALKAKHATERQDTDLPNLSKTVIRQVMKNGSVKGKSQMYQQALTEGEVEKSSKPAPAPRRRLNADWTQRRDSYDEYVVQYVPPPLPENAPVEGGGSANTTVGEGPARYLPRPRESDVGPTSSRTTSRASSFGSGNLGTAAASESKPKISASSSTGSITGTKSGAERSNAVGKSIAVIESKTAASAAVSNEEARPGVSGGAAQEGSTVAKGGNESTATATDSVEVTAEKEIVKKEEVERRKESAAPPAEKAPAVTTGNGSEMESMQKTKQEMPRSAAGNGTMSTSSRAPAATTPAVDRVAPETSTSGGCCVVS